MPYRAPVHFIRKSAPKRRETFYGTTEWKAARERVVKRDGRQCTMGDCLTPDRGRGGRLIVDHRIARKDGGADDDSNLQTLCPACDNRKHGFKARRVGLPARPGRG